MISNQVFFNKVKRHLLRQKRKCATAKGCAIMSPKDGTRCAIGGALPMKIARYLFDSGDNNIDISSLYGRKEMEKYMPFSGSLARALQHCHDDYAVDMWKDQLGIIASEFNLKP
jgi:hypothetical protein